MPGTLTAWAERVEPRPAPPAGPVPRRLPFTHRAVQAPLALPGLAPALLFATGFLMWWNRVVAPRRRRARPVS
jgi:hypothetical protein